MTAQEVSVRAVSSQQSAATFFARFSTIVLVANSDAVDIAVLKKNYPADTLFVFFNKVYKVLDQPFEGEALLVARSGGAGANIVRRREVEDVLRLVDGPRFHGILNLKSGASEAFSSAEDFGGSSVGHLDVGDTMQGFYPETQVPTSGFAMAMFLVENCPEATVVLAGFTARRSVKWKLFVNHDWTFEQIVLRLLFRAGRLHMGAGSVGAGASSLLAISERLPGVSPQDVSLVAGEVLSERLDNAHLGIDDLMKVTRAQRWLDAFVRSFKPRSRRPRTLSEHPK